MMTLPPSASGRPLVEVVQQAATVATDIILTPYRALAKGNPMEKTAKGRGNWVTQTDVACEEAVIAMLRAEYPDIRVLSEETSSEVEHWDRGWLWVMDPIDGTSNFARGIPTFVFTLALCLDGEPVVGLTHQPVTGAQFLAVEEQGLLVNGEPAHVSPAEHLGDALTGFGLGYEYGRAKMMLGLLADLYPGIQMAQNIGTAALGLAYAASGRFDLYVHSYLFPWDMAAGIIQVRAAGGVALARDGSPATIYSEGIVAGAAGPAREFVAATGEREWR
jgi:myo-inositol-1(or 4)-monophosphatase